MMQSEQLVKRKFVHQKNGRKFATSIPLDKQNVAPESVKVYLNDEEIFPDHFSDTGMPIFSDKTSLIFYCREKIVTENRMTGHTNGELTVYASYELATDDLTVKDFDSYKAVSDSLQSLEAFNELCQRRRNYVIETSRELHRFLVFGRILLDKNGNLRRIKKLRNKALNMVFDPNNFMDILSEHLIEQYVPDMSFMAHPPIIPQSDEKCPYCGKKFSIDDLKGNLCRHQSEIVHNGCYERYCYYNEINEVIFSLVDVAFLDSKFQFEIIRNPYMNYYRLPVPPIESKPWFIVHANCGDIKIGRGARNTHIEWRSNYAPWCPELPYYEYNLYNGLRDTHRTLSNRKIATNLPEGIVAILAAVHKYVLNHQNCPIKTTKAPLV